MIQAYLELGKVETTAFEFFVRNCRRRATSSWWVFAIARRNADYQTDSITTVFIPDQQVVGFFMDGELCSLS
jgi:hypothetical protein